MKTRNVFCQFGYNYITVAKRLKQTKENVLKTKK